MGEGSRESPFEGTSLAFRAYYIAIVTVGAWLALRFFPSARVDEWPPVLWWMLFAFIAESSPILLPGSNAYITVSSALDYAAIVVFGPVVAAIIATVTTIVSSTVISRQPPFKILFNVCLFIITIMTAGFVFKFAGGSATPDIRHVVVPLAACGATYFAIDTFGVSIIVALQERASAWRVWQRTYLWTTVTHLVGFVPLGAIIVVIFLHIGSIGVALFLFPLVLARYSFKLYMDMREAHFDTVRALTSAIDASDPFTRGHAERVTEYAIAIAREMGLSERRVLTVEYASLLHDMGKIALQHDILLKPGALTEEEWEVMRGHPEIGARIVSDLHFLKGAHEVVLYHHERYDGKGYPKGLKGTEIPMEARIIKVADAFDAMMSDRPYRKALDADVALNELREGCSTEFDPDVVGAFLRVIERGDVELPSSNEAEAGEVRSDE